MNKCVLMSFVFASLPLVAGETATKSDAPVFRSATKLVQVNVVAQDRNKQSVLDLKRDDFTVYENGVPQKIAFFVAERADRLVGANIKLSSNVYSNRLGLRASAPGSVTVILLDSLNTTWADQVRARAQVLRFLQQIRPDDRIGIYALGRGLRVLHDYTSDSASLVRLLAVWRGELNGRVEDSNPEEGVLQLLASKDLRTSGESSVSDFVTTNRAVETLRAFEAIARHLSAVPGRKSLIWVSGSFPVTIGYDTERMAGGLPAMATSLKRDFQRASQALSNADISVYPMDARGLMASDPATFAENGNLPKQQSLRVENFDTMEMLAHDTGGRAFYNQNDIDHAIREVVSESNMTYTLAYYPSGGEPDGKFHEIKISVERPGVSLRYRRGYYAMRNAESSGDLEKKEIQNLVWSPLDATAVPLNVRVEFNREKNQYEVSVQIDPIGLTIEPEGDRWKGRMAIVSVLKARDGRKFGEARENIRMNLQKPTYEKIQREGIQYYRSVPVVKGADILRVIVRDAPSGLAGTVTIPLAKVVALR